METAPLSHTTKTTGSRRSGLPRPIKMLDWYIISKFIGTFFFIIAMLALIACVIDLSEKIGDLIKNHAPVSAMLGYYGVFIPHIIALLYPLFIFIAVILFTSRLAYRSEIIVMLATGMSFPRFMRPFVLGGAFLSGVFLLANHILIPIANKHRLAFEDAYWHNKISSSDQDVHLQLSKDLLVYIHSYDYNSNIGSQFTAEKVNGTVLKEKLFAETASYDSLKKIWTLRKVWIRTNDSLQESLRFLEELKQQYAFTPRDLRTNVAIKEALTTPQLTRHIAEQQLRGNESLNVFYLEKYRRTANPFAAIILTVIGACIASRKVRGGSGLHLAVGVVLSAVYMLALQFTNTFSANAGFSPLVAVWIPNMLFGLIALVLFWQRSRLSK